MVVGEPAARRRRPRLTLFFRIMSEALSSDWMQADKAS